MTTLFIATVGLVLLATDPSLNDLGKAIREANFAAVDAAINTAIHSPTANRAANIDVVQRDLSNPNPAIRQLAAYALSQLDAEQARQAVPALVEALQNPEPRVRARLALAFAKLGPAGRAAIPSLTEQLRDEDPRCRAGAARALGSMGAEATGAVPALAGVLKDPEPPVRVMAAMALGQLGPLAQQASPALRLAQRTDADSDVRAAAAAALEEVDPAVALVFAALHDADSQRRLWAISRLIADPTTGRQAISPLTQLLTQDADAGVRAGAALALGKIGADAQSAGPALIQALKDSSAKVRGTAALALGLIGPGVTGSAGSLAKAISDPDLTVSDTAATSLGNLGPAAEEAVPLLVGMVEAKEPNARRRAVNVLARIGTAAKPATAALLRVLNDDSRELRRDACRAMISLGPQTQVPVSVLIECLHDRQDELSAPVRAWAGLSIAAIGPPAIDTLPSLMDTLRDKEGNVRAAAALALARLGPGATPSLVGGLDHLDPEVRAGSALALAGMGAAARRAIAPLIRAVRDEDPRVSLAAVLALGSIARGLQLQHDGTELPELENILAQLPETTAMPPGSPEAAQWQAARLQVREAVKALRQAKQGRFFGLLDNPWLSTLAIGTLVFGSWIGVGFLLLWLRPLALLAIGEKLRNLPQVQLPIGVGSITLSLRDLLLLGFFEHHPRVLDAWIARRREVYWQNFEAKPTMQRNAVYVPLPITLDGQEVAAPTAAVFTAAFDGKRGYVLICGPKGTGKTNLACSLARSAAATDRNLRLCQPIMLPVSIEQGLKPSADADGPNHRTLTDAVRGQIQAMLPGEPPLSESLILALLRHRRLLVIVDGPATDADGTLAAIRPDQADFPVHSLVIVSRQDESLGGLPRMMIRMQEIDGSLLRSFVEAYQKESGRRSRGDDSQSCLACEQLATLVGRRRIPVAFARCIAELLTADPENQENGSTPANVVELMRAYVFQQNRAVFASQRRNEVQVLADARKLAWECLRATLHPEPVSLSSALEGLGGADARNRLAYLEQLGLVRIAGADRSGVSFPVEALAECLAALELVNQNGNDQPAWQAFLKQYPDTALPDPGELSGFWLALHHACRQRPETRIILPLLDRSSGRAA